ncbi:hypothetical protein GCM10010387_14350 [Streptomyces inusitatus]|uniref:Uncharacterized protein n=1 Tax=Streptomyces inusitatus TaxID=68221 RepID=A0A918PUH4_9ACTN|nr:hypothetical protein [Streptomyces inusitatus]GGZ22320.1 hypothetical protein GCM10010387_14350 [Streptomyces inusitatus]
MICLRCGLAHSREDNTGLQTVLAALDHVLDTLHPTRAADRHITRALEAQMGQTIQTRGCPKCGGTMYRTVDTDPDGNQIGAPQYVCSNHTCGTVE